MKRTAAYPQPRHDAGATRVVGHAGGMLLTKTAVVTGLTRELSTALARWRKPLATHDPGKILSDLAITLALGGDCLADAALLRSEPAVYGMVASDPTISRLISLLAADAPRVLKAIDAARAAARTRAWLLAGEHAPDSGMSVEHPLIVDVDATLVTAHSDKEHAKPTFKKGYGFHPLCVFVDHGRDGTGEPLALLLRPGNAGSNTAADHITVLRQAFKQLPGRSATRPAKRVLVRADGAGHSHQLLDWLTGQRVQYSVGWTLPSDAGMLIEKIPDRVWTPAYDADRQPRDGAWVAELTGLLDLSGWPPGMRVIIRKERPHPGAQLRITDVDGHRITAFATNTTRGQLADLELRHRRRARCEDRIRLAKDTGLTNLPLYSFAQNQVWCAIVALACDLTAWMQMLALADADGARRWEPKRLRYRLYTIPAVLVRGSRQVRLRYAAHHPWAAVLIGALTTLTTLDST
ncbi:IS1380 family transposase [Propioniciclava sinopodophylli]|uniref:IS1380 family transposase n=1 Tax=Propioniciclava sinopodophylli TaxID=1837344 RepID=UPI00248FFACE|nr:IS1380 family transposase [Propioniciclava sinopodophylli]